MSARVWTRMYDEGVPSTLRPYPETTLVELVRETAQAKAPPPPHWIA